MSDGKLFHCQRYDETRNITIPYTEQKVDDLQGNEVIFGAAKDVLANDFSSYTVRIWGGTNIPEFDAFFLGLAGRIDLNLPNVLSSITCTFSTNVGDGSSTHNVGTAVAAGTSGGVNVDPSSSAQASASIVPDIQPVINSAPSNNVPVNNYLFYIQGSVTEAAVLTKLTTLLSATVHAWPKFNPTSHVFTLVGKQVSISQQADSHLQVRWSSTDQSYAISPFSGSLSEGKSIETGISIRTIQLPPMIHGSITLSPASATATCTVTVKADIPAPTSSGSAPSVSGVTNEPTPLSVTLTGTISPSSISATSGTAAIPTTGLYLYALDSELDIYGYSRVRATVVDMSYFA